MATFMALRPSMNGFRSALAVCLECFTSGLAREHAHEGAQLIVRLRVELFPRVRANAPHISSPRRPSCSRRSAMIRPPMLNVDAGSRTRSAVVDLAGVCGVFFGPLHSRERRGIGARVFRITAVWAV
jgi:hypothetical protein